MASAKLMSGDEVSAGLKQLNGWSSEGNSIAKTFSFKNYYETMAFVNAVAWIAHRADHHPDLEVGYSKCKVKYSTHSVGGVSDKDVEAAREVEALV
jgi:4a-hydroxytetrahydrobiopterin dehydratase